MPFRRALDALVLWFLPERLRAADADTLRRAKLCVAYNLTVPLWGPAFVWLLWRIDQPIVAVTIAAGMSLVVLPLIALRTTGSLTLAGHAMAGVCTGLMVACAWFEGGLAAPGVLWFPIVPMLALLVGGRGVGTWWAGIMAAVLIAFYVLERAGVSVPVFLGPADPRLALLRLALGVGAILTFLGLAALFESLKAQALHSLEVANDALGRALEQAEEATRAKSSFLATMSHEIRTPLHGVFGMTEIARDSDDRQEARECIDRARACAETLLTIINDVLDFSRIDAGKLTLEHTRFDPRDVVDGVLDTLAVEVHRKSLDLIGCVGRAVPAAMLGDAGRIRQILTNLAGNAVKFTETGSVVIALDTRATDAGIVLTGSVRDTGIGISPEAQASVFDAFTQADTSTTRRFGGTGLGLAITRRLVELMDGTLAVESTPGVGSAFRFEVRLASAVPSVTPAVPALLADRSVLVVASGGTLRRHLEHTLRERGGRPAVLAPDAPLPSAPPPLTIVDLADREDERRALLERLRAWPARHATTIVALVPIGQDALTRAAAALFAGTVSKPLKTRALDAVLAARIPALATTVATPPENAPTPGAAARDPAT